MTTIETCYTYTRPHTYTNERWLYFIFKQKLKRGMQTITDEKKNMSIHFYCCWVESVRAFYTLLRRIQGDSPIFSATVNESKVAIYSLFFFLVSCCWTDIHKKEEKKGAHTLPNTERDSENEFSVNWQMVCVCFGTTTSYLINTRKKPSRWYKGMNVNHTHKSAVEIRNARKR